MHLRRLWRNAEFLHSVLTALFATRAIYGQSVLLYKGTSVNDKWARSWIQPHTPWTALTKSKIEAQYTQPYCAIKDSRMHAKVFVFYILAKVHLGALYLFCITPLHSFVALLVLFCWNMLKLNVTTFFCLKLFL